MVPQQWLVSTTAPGIAPDDHWRLDLVIYGAAPLGGAFGCDATLVSPLTRAGEFDLAAAAQNGTVLRTALRRKHATYTEFAACGAPLAAARHAAACLREQSYDVPAWVSLLQARPAQEERELGDFLRGWQHRELPSQISQATSARLICVFPTSMPHFAVAVLATRCVCLRSFPNLS